MESVLAKAGHGVQGKCNVVFFSLPVHQLPQAPSSAGTTATGRVGTQRCRCAATAQLPDPGEGAAAAAAVTAPSEAAAVAPQPWPVLPPAPNLQGASPQGRWNAVSLAYLGDAAWEAMLRSCFYDAANPWTYGKKVASMVTTQAQAACYQLLLAEGWVTPEEAALMRWATNNASVTPPPHSTRLQYKQATSFEALVAHLYLTDADRLQQLLAWLLEPCRVKEWQQQMPVLAIPQRGRQAGKHSRAGSSREAKRPSTGTATGEAAPLSRDTAEVHGPPSGGHL